MHACTHRVMMLDSSDLHDCHI